MADAPKPTDALQERVTSANDAPINANGDYVLYYVTAYRRSEYNHALDRAVQYSRELGRPLLVLEALRCDYRWASDRIHRFIMQGMKDSQAAFTKAGVTYYPYVEREPKEVRPLLQALAKRACAVLSDDFQAFFLPGWYRELAADFPVRFELVDSNGLMPVRAVPKMYPTAAGFRRMLQKVLPRYLERMPSASLPRASYLAGAKVPAEVKKRWPATKPDVFVADTQTLATLHIDHTVGAANFDGGTSAGRKRLKGFLSDTLVRYQSDRNHPDRKGQSYLSPYLHHGQISAYEIFARLRRQEQWDLGSIAPRATGSREGFWGMSAAAESFFDEFVTWRELGDNTCYHRPHDYDRFESLPDWAQKTLNEHRDDPRDTIYSFDQLAAAQTSDKVWNAAQLEIQRTGSLHNYMRMLWGKRVIAWTKCPEDAIEILIELNNKYGVDGRDSNSWAGIMWCFGRYDRPWPSHPIYGKIRYMTSESTLRKLQCKEYMRQFAA